jgi:TRAP-type C4-dicarboxylate transport system permease large subunit
MAGDVPLEDVFKGVTYFLPAYMLCVIILMLVPEIVTFLPAFMH